MSGIPADRVSRKEPPRRAARNPRILGGEPTMAGTRVPVRTIVEATRYIGSIDEIVQAYPMLDRTSVEIALDFYRRNQAKIDGHIAANAD